MILAAESKKTNLAHASFYLPVNVFKIKKYWGFLKICFCSLQNSPYSCDLIKMKRLN